jgi:hypothetical protein
LHARTNFRRYRWHRVPFSYFVISGNISAVRRASGLDFMSYARGLVSYCTEGVGSHFHVLRSRTCFWRYGGRRLPFSCFAFPDLFSAIPRASGPVFLFCAPGLVFDGTEGVGSRVHVFSFPYSFSAVRRVTGLFSCFAISGTFLAIRRTSGLDFIFCAL